MAPLRWTPGPTGAHRRLPTPSEWFGAVLDVHGAALADHARRLTGDGAEAEDLVQETLLRAWQHPGALDGTKGSARGWLFTVARNLAVDRWRRQGERALPLDLDRLEALALVPGGGDPASRLLDEAMVSVALEGLSDAHRDVLTHVIWRDESVAEAAAALGIAPGTVKSRTYYALRALRLALDEVGYDR